ncbi:mobilization protein [Rubellimicrobium rubrum]|uniref:mobilization protein n=1 Tax=Rubellimicrobium rubrum TaxID=2585369 RepID=UPI00159BEB4E
MKNLDVVIAQYEARLRDLKAQVKRQERKADTRRKILYGAAYLAMVETLSEDQRARSLARVHGAVTNPKDRAFLGLPTLKQPETQIAKVKGVVADPDADAPKLPFL